jgi:hypothetical protein
VVRLRETPRDGAEPLYPCAEAAGVILPSFSSAAFRRTTSPLGRRSTEAPGPRLFPQFGAARGSVAFRTAHAARGTPTMRRAP